MQRNKSARLVFVQGFILGLAGLSFFYFLLLVAITQDLSHPLSQFWLFQPWMSLLVLGFGVQLGLFNLIRKGFSYNLSDKKDSRLAVGTGSSVSGLAMVACCAHHAVELLPIIGLSAATLFLSQYQEQFLIFGVIANLLGIGMMLWFVTGRASAKVIVTLVVNKLRRSYEY